MDRLNVLSIDWDYFVDASMEDRVRLFPDGGNENIPTVLGNFIWTSRYVVPKLKNDVGVDKPAIRKIKKIMKMNCNHVSKVMVMDSHKYAYDFIVDYCNNYKYDSLNLVNIDFHHDIYDNGLEVDCGNWLRKLINNFSNTDSEFTWVMREDSDLGNYFTDECKLEKTTSLDIADNYVWDIVFICKSSMWSPPHLDVEFKNTFKNFCESMNYEIEERVFTDRYKEIKPKISEEIELRRKMEETLL